VAGDISPISSRKNVPPARGGEESLLVAYRARERAFDVAEELRLEQAFGQRAAVQRKEQAFCARRQLVEVAGDDFLTRSRFALDQDGAFGRGDLLRQAQHVAEQAGLAEGLHLAGALAAADFLLELLVLRAQPAMFGGAAADRHHVVVRERLLYIVESAFVHGLDGRLERCLGRHEDDRCFGVLPADG